MRAKKSSVRDRSCPLFLGFRMPIDAGLVFRNDLDTLALERLDSLILHDLGVFGVIEYSGLDIQLLVGDTFELCFNGHGGLVAIRCS